MLAAAIRGGAPAIVTANLKHFPSRALTPFNVEAIHPDDFVLDLLDLAPGVILKILDDQVRALKKPPVDLAEVLDKLEANGLAQSVSEVRRLMAMDGIS